MNPNCPRCGANGSVKHGSNLRRDDAQTIQRYRCVDCSKNHSSATHTDTYRQKCRRLNAAIEMDVVSSTSQRRIASKQKCDRKTVARKIQFLAACARKRSVEWLSNQPSYESVQWDEFMTFEHSRLKPLSVAVISCTQSRCIIAYGSGTHNRLWSNSSKSVEKFGKRCDESGAKCSKRSRLK